MSQKLAHPYSTAKFLPCTAISPGAEHFHAWAYSAATLECLGPGHGEGVREYRAAGDGGAAIRHRPCFRGAIVGLLVLVGLFTRAALIVAREYNAYSADTLLRH
jgi:hypothetical protein